MITESPKFNVRVKELKGKKLGEKAISIASHTIFNIYPLLKQEYSNRIDDVLSDISFDKEFIEKLTSPNQKERLQHAFDVGTWVIHKTLRLIPDRTEYGKYDEARPFWKAILRRYLPPEESPIVDSPGVKFVARGAEIFTVSPKQTFMNSTKIGENTNEGIIQLLMASFLPKYAEKMDVEFVNPPTAEMREATEVLKNIDESLLSDRTKLLKEYVGSKIPDLIFNSLSIPLLDYPR